MKWMYFIRKGGFRLSLCFELHTGCHFVASAGSAILTTTLHAQAAQNKSIFLIKFFLKFDIEF
jgi:hypothetical protein